MPQIELPRLFTKCGLKLPTPNVAFDHLLCGVFRRKVVLELKAHTIVFDRDEKDSSSCSIRLASL